MFVLETRAVCKYFRAGSKLEVRAVDQVSLSIAPGSFVVVRGSSGSGKTTLLALLGVLDRPTAGQVLFHGKDLSACSDVELARLRRRMGFVFQDFSLIANLPVWENITYPLIPRGLTRSERFARAQALLGRLAMSDKLSGLPKELSGGEQQRVAIARALAGDPEVVLADEPTSNLDPENGTALLAILREIQAEGKTVVVSSHDPQVISLATSVHELVAGRLKTKHTGA